ncbi:unnamed protein product [Caenorhabditis angaria]|uniref:Peptidase C1A papain C-terminal domain-containing protein n=1 Tax=Caenorhabditis angaria TaxID=860376 RepID=A0A9P1N556_9PELO|nr:unnamed protein product [Caenorhabditis angaria]
MIKLSVFLYLVFASIYVKTDEASLIQHINSIQNNMEDFGDLGAPIREEVPIINEISNGFDARQQWPECESIQIINDQSECKSSWAISATDSMSDRLCINSGGMIKKVLSAQDILTCCGGGVLECGEGCNGGNPYKAWQFWEKHGVVTGGGYGSHNGCRAYSIAPCGETIGNVTYPECTNVTQSTPACTQKCDDGFSGNYKDDKHFGNNDITQLPKSVTQIQSDIITGGPIQTTMEIFDDFLQYTTGIYVHLAGDKLGKLSVRILGWGVDNGVPYWLMANSWGRKWGEN